MTLRDDKLWYNRRLKEGANNMVSKMGILGIIKGTLYWKDKKVEDLTKEELVEAVYETIAVLEEIKGLMKEKK